MLTIAADHSIDQTPMANGIGKGWEKAFAAAFALLFAAALALIWGHRFLPMQDYPIWLSEGDILSRLLAGAADGNFGIVPYPVPNAASTAIIGLLGVMMNGEIAGKVFLSLAVIVFALGAYWLTSPPPGLRRNASSLMPLALMLGFPFFHGNINYFLGLGLFMLGAGYLIRRADGGRSVRPWPLVALSVAMFFSHALALVAWAVLVGAYLVNDRRRGQWKVAALAHLPAMVLLAACLAGRAIWPVTPLYGAPGAVDSLTVWAKNKVAELLYYLYPFGLFHPFLAGPWPSALAIVNGAFLLVLAVVTVTGAWRTVRDGRDRWLLAACGVYLLGWLGAPPYLAPLSSPGQRLVLPGALVALAMASRRPWGRRGRTVAAAWAAGLLIFTAAYLLVYVGGTSAKLADCYTRLHRMGPPADCAFIDEGLFHFEGRLPACRTHEIWRKVLLGDHSVLGRLGYYLSVERRSGGAVFGTSILRARRNPPVLRTVDAILQNAPDRLVLLGCDEGNALIAAELSEKYRVCSLQANITVLESRQLQ
jgi:hypothetical protein